MGLTAEDIRKLLADTESDRVERKESMSGDSASKIRQAVCAFANDLPNHRQPGYVIVGARDDGSLSGLPITDQLLQNLAHVRDDGKTVPPPSISVASVALDGGKVAVIRVLPHDTPPVQYDGRIWVRVGPRRGIATDQEERILNEKRRYFDKTFDIKPMPSASVADLDLVKFTGRYLPAAVDPEVLRANDRTVEQRLAAMKMLATASETTPTVLGILVLGRNVSDFIPGAYVEFRRVAGLDVAAPTIDNLRIEGAVDDVVRRCEEKLESHNRTMVDYADRPVEVRRSTYPMGALKQILRNAILHRAYEGTNAPVRVTWFEDRLEIHNPGGPYGAISVENFGVTTETDYRNPNLAQAMKHLGLIQSFGSGITLARQGLRENGNPEPEFRATQTSVTVVMRPALGQ